MATENRPRRTQQRARKVRDEFDDMLTLGGCPACQSDQTHETTVSVNARDHVEVRMCDNCGHVELKFEGSDR